MKKLLAVFIFILTSCSTKDELSITQDDLSFLIEIEFCVMDISSWVKDNSSFVLQEVRIRIKKTSSFFIFFLNDKFTCNCF